MWSDLFSYCCLISYFFLVAWGLARTLPFFRAKLAPLADAGKINSLEGLRGILALTVFVSHAIVHRGYWTTHVWQLPAQRIFASLGPVGVLMFFYLSGYLFWSKLIDADGALNARRFLIDRCRRVMPAYYASIVAILVVVFAHTGFRFQPSPLGFLSSLLPWVTFGLPDNAFTDINGLFGSSLINAQVGWTLSYEWLFYLSLPLLAPFARGKRIFALFAAVGVAYVFLRHEVFASRIAAGTNYGAVTTFLSFLTYIDSGFGVGMLVAYLQRRYSGLTFLRHRAFGVLAVVSFALTLRGFEEFPWRVDYVLGRFSLFVAFICIACGNDVFGALVSRPARLLGALSYSIYLFHAIVLFVLFEPIRSSIPQMGDVSFFALVAVVGTIVIAVSLATYRWIELPFLARASRHAPPSSRQTQSRAA